MLQKGARVVHMHVCAPYPHVEMQEEAGNHMCLCMSVVPAGVFQHAYWCVGGFRRVHASLCLVVYAQMQDLRIRTEGNKTYQALRPAPRQCCSSSSAAASAASRIQYVSIPSIIYSLYIGTDCVHAQPSALNKLTHINS
jgi:hypothetical protein